MGGDATTCDSAAGFRFLGGFEVPAGQTYSEAMESPIVLKPLAIGKVWCLIADAQVKGGPTGALFPHVSVGGYVAAGTLPAGAVAADRASAAAARRGAFPRAPG